MSPQIFTGVLDYKCQPAPPRNWRTVGGSGSPGVCAELAAGPIAVASTARLDTASLAFGILAVLDGYLDNHVELAAQLGLGSEASAELVIAAGYRRWKTELLSRLRGDFALLVWDRNTEGGFVACDQFAVRSLYLRAAGTRLSFASDLLPLLSALPSRPAPDEIAVVDYLSLRVHAPGRTMYDGIVELPPAHAVIFGSSSWRTLRYWTPVYGGVLEASPDELTHEVRRVMGEAVQRRLDPQGLTAVTMSGGLDSTTVAALAARHGPGAVRAYSITMPGFPDEDEAGFVEAMSLHTGLPVTMFPAQPAGIVAAGLGTLRLRQLPAMTTTDFLRRSPVAAARADGATLLLGGDGGDEVFGPRVELIGDLAREGRAWAALELARRHPDPGPPPPRRALAGPVARFAGTTLRPHVLDDLALRLDGPKRYFAPWLRPGMTQDAFAARTTTSWKRAEGPRWWARLADILTRNHARVGLYVEARQTAQEQGLDQRHPLLDFDLVDLALRLPPDASFNREL